VWEPRAVYLKKFKPYDDAIARTKLAMQKGVLKGVLWHQGESDNDSLRAAVYLNKLEILIGRLRTELQEPKLPFIAGEIGYFNKANFINKTINKLPFKVNHTAVVSARDLSDVGDHLHFNTPSARELGKRYAKAIKQVQDDIRVIKNTSARDEKSLKNAPIVVLGFDDAEISHYTVVAPLLKRFGFGATFFVCEMPWKQPADSMFYMNWNHISKLHKMGFEIGNHTGHHRNMTKLSRKEMQEEISFIEHKCKENKIPKPISFAYPGNRVDSLSQVVLSEMGYKYGRQGNSQYYDLKEDSRLAIPSYTMGSSEKLKDRTWSALKNLKQGQVLAFTIHGVPDVAHPDYTTSEEVFTAFLQYMKEKQFRVIAMRDLDKYKAMK
jgi:peptidoglycan/xylan/chitin deacetylase (PgdA/CDA1 family)